MAVPFDGYGSLGVGVGVGDDVFNGMLSLFDPEGDDAVSVGWTTARIGRDTNGP